MAGVYASLLWSSALVGKCAAAQCREAGGDVGDGAAKGVKALASRAPVLDGVGLLVCCVVGRF